MHVCMCAHMHACTHTHVPSLWTVLVLHPGTNLHCFNFISGAMTVHLSLSRVQPSIFGGWAYSVGLNGSNYILKWVQGFMNFQEC